MQISKKFGLNKSQYELDFVDIDIEKDTPLFLDPYFISKMEFPMAEAAYKTLRSYFNYLLALLRQDHIDEAKEIFSFLGETNEICLGMSKGKPSGKGMGPKDAEEIFKKLIESKAYQTGLMEDIEDFQIFVPNVDKDKVSDMTANIIKIHLIKYTQEQCKLWDIPLIDSVPSGNYWDEKNLCWTNIYSKMLVADGHKFILVPKRLVSYSKEYTSEKYTQHFVLNFLQNEQLRMNTSLVKERVKSKEKYVTKKDIKENELVNHTFDKEWLAKFTLQHPEVFAEFKKKTISNISCVSNEELSDEKLFEITRFLIDKLKSIPAGAENATLYHRTVVGIMELLFYPALSSPIVEEEIHEGRKRIDIVFDNCAEEGFFYRLATTYGITCRFIMIECKNYSRDIKNPELDQLAGRFSPNRGKFGIAACRKIDDMKNFLNRCTDTYKDNRGLIIPLVDDDFIEMLEKFPQEGLDVWETIIQNKFHTVAMK